MKEYIEFMYVRRNIYSLLGEAFYKEPMTAYMEKFRRYTTVLKEIADQCQDDLMKKGLDIFNSCPSDEKYFETQANEFARLFLGVMRAADGKTITPHESVYLSASGFVMQEPWEQVIEIYARQKAERNKEKFKEPEDHISAEMMFIVYMTDSVIALMEERKESEWAENINTQKDFIKDHLAVWVPSLCADIEGRTTSEYFQSIAIITKQFLSNDLSYLKAMSEIIINK